MLQVDENNPSSKDLLTIWVMTGARVSKLSLINLVGKGSWIAEALELALIIFLTSSSSTGLKDFRVTSKFG